MKVCLIVSDFAPKVGGIATFNSDLAAALAHNSHVEHVLVLAFQGDETKEEELSPKLTVKWFPRKNIVQLFFVVARVLFNARTYDVFHSPNIFPVGFFALIFAKYLLRKPFVVTFHGTDVLARGGSAKTRWAKRFTMLHASATATVSHAIRSAAARWYRVNAEKFSVIYYSLPALLHPHLRADARAEWGIAESEIMVLTAGNLVKRKGFDDAIRAIKFVEDPRVMLYIAGDGPERRALQSLVPRLMLETRVRFLGRVPDINSLYAAADVFVLASRFLEEDGDIEGLGIVLLEAQRSGVPVVATRSGGIPEALLENETGFLVDESDPEALARHINELARDPERRARMGKKGREFVHERFNQTRAAQEYVSLYERLSKKSIL